MNTLEKIQQQMDDLRAERSAEIRAADEYLQAARETIAKASEAMMAATDAGDLPGYEAAKRDRDEAQNAAAMYSARKNRLLSMPLATDAQSDQAIEALEGYIDGIAKECEQTAAEALGALNKAIDTYFLQANAVDVTMKNWAEYIHKNQKSRTATGYKSDLLMQARRMLRG